jgi:hypothetical protein
MLSLKSSPTTPLSFATVSKKLPATQRKKRLRAKRQTQGPLPALFTHVIPVPSFDLGKVMILRASCTVKYTQSF